MNLGVATIAFGLACAWVGALFSMAALLLLYAHGERDRQADREAIDVEVEA